jgi:hypothetical protein
MSVARYQGLIADLEFYLDYEIKEWRGIAESSTDRRDYVTFDALVDMKNELDRLKSLYFPQSTEER